MVSFFEDENNRKNIERLLAAGIRPEAPSRKDEGAVAGRSFVITGSLKGMTRSEAEELIRDRGGRLASSVSRGTDFLVVGESPGSKLEKARDLGVTIIDENEFLRLMGERVNE